MLHRITGNNFHGSYSITLRLPAAGGRLSRGQMRRVGQILCGLSDCKCGGGYGDGPAPGSPYIEWDFDAKGNPIALLRPAPPQ